MNQIHSQKEADDQLNKHPKTLAVFFASWCPFCRNFLATVDKTLGNYGFEYIIHVNLDDYDNSMWDDYSIAAVPTLIYFENGKISKRLDAEAGAGLTEKRCKEWLEKIKTM